MRKALTFVGMFIALAVAVMQGPNADSVGDSLATGGSFDDCTYSGYAEAPCTFNPDCTAGNMLGAEAPGVEYQPTGGTTSSGNCTGNANLPAPSHEEPYTPGMRHRNVNGNLRLTKRPASDSIESGVNSKFRGAMMHQGELSEPIASSVNFLFLTWNGDIS